MCVYTWASKYDHGQEKVIDIMMMLKSCDRYDQIYVSVESQYYWWDPNHDEKYDHCDEHDKSMKEPSLTVERRRQVFWRIPPLQPGLEGTLLLKDTFCYMLLHFLHGFAIGRKGTKSGLDLQCLRLL